MAAYIPHLEAFVPDFFRIVDIILFIGQNKNTLAFYRYGLDWEAFLQRVDTGFAEAVKGPMKPVILT
jgi:hypothetical protein